MRAPTASSHDSGLDEMVRFGTIAAVDLSTGHCTIDTGDVQTQQIRWLEVRAGDTRTWSPPTLGEQVVLLCPGGQIEGAIALRGLHQDAFPPAGNSLRELISFKDGAELAYDPESHVLDVKLPDGGTVNIVATGGVHIKGDVTVEGDVTADGVSLKHHRHQHVEPGAGISGEPVGS